MGGMRLSRGGRLAVAVLGVVWACVARVPAQGLTPPANPPSAGGLQSLDRLTPPAADGSNVPPPLLGGSDPALSGVESEPSSTSTASQPTPFGGPWNTRSKLTGDWWGSRERLRDSGVTLDASATTYYQGITRGGVRETFRFGGRNDYLLNVDGQKAGLWQGFFVNVHGETVYGDSVNTLTGAVVPVNIGGSLPAVNGTVSAVTNVKFTQALSENFVLYAGKINTIDNVQQPFMRGRGLDAGFMNGAFVFNPVLGRTIPYSTFGAGAAVLADGYPVASLTVYDTNDSSTRSVFNNLFDNGAVIYPTLSLPTKFFGLPGHQSLWGAYSSGSYAVLNPQSLNLIPLVFQGQADPASLTAQVRGSWWITYLFDQAMWVDPADQTRTWGVFGNAGISDGKPNPIRWAGVIGVGGCSPIADRGQDRCGVAYYYLGYSDAFKRDFRPVVPLRDEHGVELFYDAAVTPWCHVATDLQVITPTLKVAETALVFGLRAKIDF